MRPYLYIMVGVGMLATSCSSGPRTEPTTKERAHLDAHVERIFADVKEEDAAQLAADRRRAADIHHIAYLVEQYKTETGTYPLVDTVEGTLKNVVIGDDGGFSEGKEHYASETEFLAELRRILGVEATLPHDPLPGDRQNGYIYVYSVYGSGYVTAAMLYHPVGWSEGILPHQWQYRVGSYESLEMPVLEAAKLFAGEYQTSVAARPRDPSMAGK